MVRAVTALVSLAASALAGSSVGAAGPAVQTDFGM